MQCNSVEWLTAKWCEKEYNPEMKKLIVEYQQALVLKYQDNLAPACQCGGTPWTHFPDCVNYIAPPQRPNFILRHKKEVNESPIVSLIRDSVLENKGILPMAIKKYLDHLKFDTVFFKDRVIYQRCPRQ